MKSFLLSILAGIVLLISTGCVNQNDSLESKQLKNDLEECLNDALTTINDSNFQKIVIESIEADSEYNVSAGMPQYEKPGVVKVDIHIDRNQSKDWFVGYAALITVVSGSIIPIAIVFIICLFIFKSKRDRNQLIATAMQHGYNLPTEFLLPRQKPRVRLQSAITYLAWGIGLLVYFQAGRWKNVSALMLIPIIIGLGKLIAYSIYELPTIINKHKANRQTDCDAD